MARHLEPQQLPLELTDKCCVDHAVALEPALPAEHLRHNIHPEMSIPALPMPGMSRVLVGFVHHVEPYGGESLGQPFRDEIAPCHGVRIAGARPVGQCRRYSIATVRPSVQPSSRSRFSKAATRWLSIEGLAPKNPIVGSSWAGGIHSGFCSCGCPRPHRRCWPSRPDLSERWPSRLVATAAESCLSIPAAQSAHACRSGGRNASGFSLCFRHVELGVL